MISSDCYIITHVKTKNLAFLGDGNQGSPVVASFALERSGEQWSVIKLSNNQYHIRNHGHKTYANAGSRSKEGDTIEGRDHAQEFFIKESEVKGQYIITTVDSGLHWALNSEQVDTEITLSSSANFSARWMFIPLSSTASVGLPGGAIEEIHRVSPPCGGVLAVEDFSWGRASSIDLPEATQMMELGPKGSSSRQKGDSEAFQVARWALDCFAHCPIPMVHPGYRGIWDALPTSIRISSGSWTYAYVFQRLIEIAALHPAGRMVALVDPNDTLSDAPQTTLAAVSSWLPHHQLLFSFCFRLHRALIKAGAVFKGGQHQSLLKSVEGFSWDVQAIVSVPAATRMMELGSKGSSSGQKGDSEAFQVALWALDCFAHCPIPMVHPGYRGIWDALPASIRTSSGSWTYAYVFQRLIEIAALHPAGRMVALVDPNDTLSDAPQTTLAAVSSWLPHHQLLFSFCFRLHRALIKAGAVFKGGEHQSLLKSVEGFSWDVQAIVRVPVATRMMELGPGGSHSGQKGDSEAFQVALWALDCFSHCPIPMVHPGYRGIWDALPASIRTSSGSWTYAYVFQRLIEIAALHPAGRMVAIVDPRGTLSDAPDATFAVVSSWLPHHQLLFSFCFRLHRALVNAGSIN